MHDESDSIYTELIALLAARGETIAAAESLTAGLFCATLAEVPGASAVLRGGAVTYATECKHQLANVPVEVLEQFGPVAPITAQHMAYGIRRRCRADWAVSLTGVAGPTEQDGHPVGEVWCGIASGRDKSAAECFTTNFCLAPSLGRNGIRIRAVELAVRTLIDQIAGFS